ncbi:MAG: HD domain-containing protein [Pirellulaceae bacterium]
MASRAKQSTLTIGAFDVVFGQCLPVDLATSSLYVVRLRTIHDDNFQCQERSVTQRLFINQLNEQSQVDEVYRAADKQLRANRQGNKYILLKLADRTGTLTGMYWNADDRDFQQCQDSEYLHVKGRTQIYNGNMQMIVTAVRPVDPAEVDPDDFDMFDASASEAAFTRLKELLSTIRNVHLRRLVEACLADQEFIGRFKQAPAAVTNHHAFPGGLLRHTVDLIELIQRIAPQYPRLDIDLLVTGAFLHDIGKTDELSAGGELSYTDRGQLVGHIVIGVQYLAEKIAIAEASSKEAFPSQLRWHLEHLILSHHGLLEYGSPKIPLTLEAIALHHIDNLDAKLAAAMSVIDSDVSGDKNWTNYNPSLGKKLWKGGIDGSSA